MVNGVYFVRIILFNHVLIYINQLPQIFYLSIYGHHFVFKKQMQIIMGNNHVTIVLQEAGFQTDWLAKFWCYYICGDLLTGGTYLKVRYWDQGRFNCICSFIFPLHFLSS